MFLCMFVMIYMVVLDVGEYIDVVLVEVGFQIDEIVDLCVCGII